MVLRSHRKGLPKGLIEAGACALPLGYQQRTGRRAMLTDGVDGLLVPLK